MKKNANWMAPTNGVIILRQILFECIWISCFYYIHSHPVQSLNGSVYGPVFLVIMHIVEPEKEQEDQARLTSAQLHAYVQKVWQEKTISKSC